MQGRDTQGFTTEGARWWAALLLALGSVALAEPAMARRGRIPVLIQVTRITQGDVWKPAVNRQRADSVVFTSDGDVTGPSPGHREVYLYEVATGTVIRITTTPDGESYDATRITDEGSPQEDYLAFISTGDLDPAVGNSDHNPELFIWSQTEQQIHQITNTAPPVVNAEPYVSDSGRCIVFRSNGDLDNNDGSSQYNPGAGWSNPDGSDEVFMYQVRGQDLTDGFYTQLSNGPAGTTSSHPTVGGYIWPRQCRSTAYQSDHDQLGNGSTGTHIYLYTRGSATLEQLTPPGPGGLSINPLISSASYFARGPFVAFQSDADLRGNGSVGFEIHRARVFHPRSRQYTFADPGDSKRPDVSDGGGFIVFDSTAELLNLAKPLRRVGVDGKPVRISGGPFNADGNAEIFRTKGRPKVYQITFSENCENTHARVSAGGRAITFRSTCDLIPGNNLAGLPQVFLYREVRRDDPILQNCQLGNGCCNDAAGCSQPVIGALRKVPRR